MRRRKNYTVDQRAGSGGRWTTLGTHPFKAGTTGKVVLGDGPASTSTAVLADALRFTKGGVVTKKPGTSNTWHSFSVTKAVQSWINGTNANHGFVVKAGDESTNGPKGGPRYEAAEYAYKGEVANYPKLVLTWGRPGVTLDAPEIIRATGAELKWSAYQDQDPVATGDDIVEYQVHRSVFQTFKPSSQTLVAPVAAGTTAFADTTATPTPADSADSFGNVFYYMVAVKTRDGEIIPAPTQIVRLPKAGRTTVVLQGSAADTTLSSTQPTTGHDTIADGGIAPVAVRRKQLRHLRHDACTAEVPGAQPGAHHLPRAGGPARPLGHHDHDRQRRCRVRTPRTEPGLRREHGVLEQRDGHHTVDRAGR